MFNASSNLRQGVNVFEKTPKDVAMHHNKNILNLAAKILRQATINAPAKTGALRRSGRVSIRPSKDSKYKVVEIGFGGRGTAVNYAVFVEQGTIYQAPQRFLFRAVQKYRKQIIKVCGDSVREAWNKNIKGVTGL